MLVKRLSELKLAMLLLTRLPVGQIAGSVPEMGASGWAWPVAGLAVALPSCGVFWLCQSLGLGPQVAALALMLGLAVLTGAMHEDGLADMADGFGGGHSRARKLEIMRDSRIGSYGVMALIFAVSLQAALIAQLSDLSVILPAAIGISMASRAVLPFWLGRMRAARPDGLGHGAANVSLACIAGALLLGFSGLLLMGPLLALSILAAIFVSSALVAALAHQQIGGQTGDVIGAMQKLSELAGWVTLTALVM